jgi:ATP-dependent exoDNAse (exonuclease V) alpha subunit
VKLDSGRAAQFNVRDNPHLDHGYAVTSHSSQGATADRVLVNVDTEAAHQNLVNSRLAYVAVSRARYDAQIYTNDAADLGRALSRDTSHTAAIEPQQPAAASNEMAQAAAASQGNEQSQGLDHGLGMEL